MRLSATGFTTAGAAAGPSIRHFLAQPPAAKRQRTANAGSDTRSGRSIPSAVIDSRLGGAATDGGGSTAGSQSAAQRTVPPFVTESGFAGPAAVAPAAGTAAKGRDADEDSYGSGSPVSTLTPPDEDASELVSMPRTQTRPPSAHRPSSAGISSRGRASAATSIAAAAAAPALAAGAAGTGAEDVDLSTVDTEEQCRILQQLQRRRKLSAAKIAPAVACGGRGGTPRQQGIAEAFRQRR